MMDRTRMHCICFSLVLIRGSAPLLVLHSKWRGIGTITGLVSASQCYYPFEHMMHYQVLTSSQTARVWISFHTPWTRSCSVSFHTPRTRGLFLHFTFIIRSGNESLHYFCAVNVLSWSFLHYKILFYTNTAKQYRYSTPDKVVILSASFSFNPDFASLAIDHCSSFDDVRRSTRATSGIKPSSTEEVTTSAGLTRSSKTKWTI